MKKILLGFGAMTGAFAVVALASCSGSQKITYKDAEGNDKEVVVTSTSDKNEVAEAMTAIAYSESQEVSKPHTFGISGSLEASMSGKIEDKKASMSLDADLDFSFDLGTTYSLENMKTYALAKISASAPISAYMGTSDDFTKNDKINIEAKSYGEANTQYFVATKLSGVAELLGLEEDSVKENFLNKYFKIANDELGDMTSGISSFIPAAGSISTSKSSKIVDSYLEKYKNATSAVDAIFPKVSQEEFKANIVKAVEQYNLSISNVNSSEVTFKITPTKEMLGKGYEEYSGDSYVSITLNTLKKLPVAFKMDLADIAEYSTKANTKDDSVSVSTLKASFDIKFDVEVPTLDAETKAKATTFPLAGLSQFMKF